MSWISRYFKDRKKRQNQRQAWAFAAGECMRHICRVITPADLAMFFDVGANDGQTVRQVRPIFPKAQIHAFEPGKDAFECLQASTSADSKVAAHQLTLGDAPGELALFRHEGSVTDSLLPEGADFYSKSPTHFAGSRPPERVQVETLDAVCAHHAIERIDIQKIDTQGFDDRVL